ncbi:ATP-binding protein [Salinarimonas ramus]|uniref:histidine kinase n=1 Tax=Salinarimonas ramus TaxID=690164 RepID=A0A917Q6E9_9HYPH|nr:ATP-binding protein [Salinarimonas ramus]GGK29057.1 hypothetical protein GCM10011322_14350 [Salinarimonas ramus]
MQFSGIDDAAPLLLAALQATPVNVTIADARRADRPLVYVNPAFTRTTGYTAKEVLGRNCRFLQGPDTDPHAPDRMRRALARGAPIELEVLNYRKNGEPFWNALVITPVRDAAGALTAFVGLQVDVTAKRREAERETHDAKMRALGALAGGVAHEINNLLQPMLSFPELIRPALPESAQDERAWLGLIEDHARAARETVRAILGFSRRDAPVHAPIDAREAIERALAPLAATLPEGIMLVREGALARGEALGSLTICSATLARALANLAGNAVHAMRKAGGVLSVGAARRGGELVIEVADTGCGMAPDVAKRVFEPFFTTKPLGEGTGLGLALVHADVTRYGGRIDVASAVGVGSRFTLRLPLAEAADEPEDIETGRSGARAA